MVTLGKGGPFLSFATKSKCRATYDLNVEAIFFCNWARLPQQPADLISSHFDIINGGTRYCYN